MVCIEVIVKFLGGFFGGLPFWGNWLYLGGISPYKTLLLSFGVFVGSCSGNWILCIVCG